MVAFALLLAMLVGLVPFVLARDLGGAQHLSLGAARRQARRDLDPYSSLRSLSGGQGYSTPRGTQESSGKQYGLTQAERTQLVDLHNYSRRKCGAPDVVWDPNLAAHANANAQTCKYGHSTDLQQRGLGENIATSVGTASSIKALFDMWNDEIVQFGLPCGKGFTDACGHWTQIVWKDTKSIGCAIAHCPAYELGLDNSRRMAIYLVCNYDPPGNVGGQYKQNVQMPNNAGPTSYGSHTNGRKGLGLGSGYNRYANSITTTGRLPTKLQDFSGEGTGIQAQDGGWKSFLRKLLTNSGFSFVNDEFSDMEKRDEENIAAQDA